jgi:hypothetical protein
MSKEIYDNLVQKAILLNSLEEGGLWEVISYISQDMQTDRKAAFSLIQSEMNYLLSQEDIYLIYSTKLYDTATCRVLDKRDLLNLTLEDVEFKEEGPFYYFSSVPEI